MRSAELRRTTTRRPSVESAKLTVKWIQENGRTPRVNGTHIPEEERRLGRFYVDSRCDLRRGVLPAEVVTIFDKGYPRWREERIIGRAMDDEQFFRRVEELARHWKNGAVPEYLKTDGKTWRPQQFLHKQRISLKSKYGLVERRLKALDELLPGWRQSSAPTPESKSDTTLKHILRIKAYLDENGRLPDAKGKDEASKSLLRLRNRYYKHTHTVTNADLRYARKVVPGALKHDSPKYVDGVIDEAKQHLERYGLLPNIAHDCEYCRSSGNGWLLLIRLNLAHDLNPIATHAVHRLDHELPGWRESHTNLVDNAFEGRLMQFQAFVKSTNRLPEYGAYTDRDLEYGVGQWLALQRLRARGEDSRSKRGNYYLTATRMDKLDSIHAGWLGEPGVDKVTRHFVEEAMWVVQKTGKLPTKTHYPALHTQLSKLRGRIRRGRLSRVETAWISLRLPMLFG